MYVNSIAITLCRTSIMELYKKRVKSSKDTVANLLSEKECKCESLQAIINEAIKENNRKTLKELVEEINSHLVDLRGINEELDTKSYEKKQKLIKLFEECLLKIVNNSSLSILNPLNAQLQELQNLTNLAIKDNDIEELKKLAARMERNIGVMKEIPEVKTARSSQNSDDKTLEVFNKYASLLIKVRTHINTLNKDGITNPTPKNKESNTAELKPSSSNQTTLTEIETKLKQMRVKRQSRLSTFVNEQSQLSEERTRENNFRRSLESANEPQFIKPSLYKTVITEQTYAVNRMKKVGQSVDKPAVAATEYTTRKSQEVSHLIQENQQDSRILSSEDYQLETPTSKRESSSSNVAAFAPKSMAETHIEQARTQGMLNQTVERPKAPLRTSNSARTTPPRTPTQIRKLFSFGCVQKSNPQHNSIEDLPGEFKSPFEQELKNIQLKSTGIKYKMGEEINLPPQSKENSQTSNSKPASRSGSFNHNDNLAFTRNQREGELRLVAVSPPTIPPRKTKPLNEKQKPEITARRNVVPPKQHISVYDPVPDNDNETFKSDVIERSASSRSTTANVQPSKDNPNPKESSADAVVTSTNANKATDPHQLTENDNEPTNVAIVIKRESNTVVPVPQRNSFTTFKDSTETSNELLAVENPIYGIINPGFHSDVQSHPKKEDNYVDVNLDRSRTESIAKDPSSNVESTYASTSFNTLDYFVAKRGRKPSYRREASVDVNKFVILQPDIAKLEFAIGLYKGLKRDEDYLMLDKMLSKYYVKIDEVPATTAFEKIKKESLRERLNQAHKDLKNKVEENENVMRKIFEEQVDMIGKKYGLSY